MQNERSIVCIPGYDRPVGFYVKTPFHRVKQLAIPGSVITRVVEKECRRLGIVYFAVSKVDAIGFCKETCSLTALKDFGIYDVNTGTLISLYALISTAVKAHILDLDIFALSETKNSAARGTCILRMACRET